jgi:hypothetical protein
MSRGYKIKNYKSLSKSLKASIHIEKFKNVPQASIHNGKTKLFQMSSKG